MNSSLADLIDDRRPGVSCIHVYPKITSGVDQLDWFPVDVYLSGLDKAPSGTREYYRGAFRDIKGDSSLTQPPLKFVEL